MNIWLNSKTVNAMPEVIVTVIQTTQLTYFLLNLHSYIL